MENLPSVKCSVSACAFNLDGCNAHAMTMGASGCKTFIALDNTGGLPKVEPKVGACQRTDCSYNNHLACQAGEVLVGADEKCLTFQAA